MSFLIKGIDEDFSLKSIQEVGFDHSYANKAVDKYNFRLLKIYNLTPQQASILKQTALSAGCDCAVHREVITCKVEKSDAILGGSIAQIKQVASKLKHQPFSLVKLSDCLLKNLDARLLPLDIRGQVFDWSKTYLMGILNVTPDSFSDGGKYFSSEDALTQAKELAQSSDIIDIGGESTRPYSQEIDPSEEIKRVCPVITSIRENGIDTPISIDTRNAETAKQAILAGADIINDVSGGVWDAAMLDVASEFQVPFILMHSIGTPQNMQDNPHYEKVVDEVYLDLSKKIDTALKKGIKKEKIIVDIGIGFGKNTDHNLELLSRISEFKSLGCPLLAGISRKSFISKDMPVEEKDIITLAINSFLAEKGVNILRVHNPQLHRKPLSFIDRL